MPPSQLKRLKAALRDQGIVGPQKSKKQKRENAQNGVEKDKRVKKNAALSGIREQFNPFEVKTSARGPKFDVTSTKSLTKSVRGSIKGRPGMAKGVGEENRRKTLLVEMHRRNKVGGILDKRFGENDPTMTPEDRMLERFTQEKSRRHKHSSTFDIEDDGEGESAGLTHMGQSLSFDGPAIDDFQDDTLALSDAEGQSTDSNRPKRRLSDLEAAENAEDAEDEEPLRKKTKQEVMKEVMAKSKLYKYERQAAKDEDEDLREELDKELSDIHALLRGVPPKARESQVTDVMGMNADRAALLQGVDKTSFDKEYDKRVRQLAQDQKSKPTERSKTDDEKAIENSQRLRELEKERLRRMEGLDDVTDDTKATTDDPAIDEDEVTDEFGLGAGIAGKHVHTDFGVEDEDDFVIDDDLVASDSDAPSSDEELSSDESQDGQTEEEDDEFAGGLLSEAEAKRPEFLTGANAPLSKVELPTTNGSNSSLAFTFDCPQTHEEFLDVTRSVSVHDLPTVVQRIRALYHPKLKAENKPKLAKFSCVLIQHISWLANQDPTAPFSIIETLIRHVHSLAKIYPTEIANAFREHLQSIHEERGLDLVPGDLILLTAIGTIFSTSDHFHQVVTPAMLTMTRYLGQRLPRGLPDYTKGIYLASLSLHYQRLSKRFVPELIGFLLNSICCVAPSKPVSVSGAFVHHEPKFESRIDDARNMKSASLRFSSVTAPTHSEGSEDIKLSILEASLKLLDLAADLWTATSAFQEVFQPAVHILEHLKSKNCSSRLPTSTQSIITNTHKKLSLLSNQAQLARRPLELHHHKPLAIKLSIPKFEESFNPDKHYDPDRERAESSKLRAEYKKERKGAMRELRKDANFIARESLREKKERDAAYEKKYKRIVAEIQGEEGREAKAYEREKEFRKKGRK